MGRRWRGGHSEPESRLRSSAISDALRPDGACITPTIIAEKPLHKCVPIALLFSEAAFTFPPTFPSIFSCSAAAAIMWCTSKDQLQSDGPRASAIRRRSNATSAETDHRCKGAKQHESTTSIQTTCTTSLYTRCALHVPTPANAEGRLIEMASSSSHWTW